MRDDPAETSGKGTGMVEEHDHSTSDVWRKRGIVLLCLLAVASVPLICWHRPLMDSLRAAWRRGEVRAALNARGNKSARRYQVRGPLTIAQVEQELFRGKLDLGSVTGASENTDPCKIAWYKMKSKYRDGDELYFVNSDERSWARLEGWRGYVLIRQNRYVDALTTFLN